MKSFRDYVARYDALLTEASHIQPCKITPPALPSVPENAPCALIFSPHPDDEALVGALPLRIRKEGVFRLVNVAVTLGSLRARRSERKAELEKSCRHLGFELMHLAKDGLEDVTPTARLKNPDAWQKKIRRVTGVLQKHCPRVVIFPHASDGHPTHAGTHYLVMDALREAELSDIFLVETEFWHPMVRPNLMVASSPDDVADLVTAISFHAGEIHRNPYHLALPAWMHDNVHRGSEILFGRGENSADCHFATLYRIKRWRHKRVVAVHPENPFVGVTQRASSLFSV